MSPLSTRRRVVIGAIAAGALVATTASCGGSEPVAETTVAVPTTAGPTTAVPTTAVPTTAVPTTAVDDPAEPVDGVPALLRFTAPLVGGGTFDGAAGDGVPTVFWFWAPT